MNEPKIIIDGLSEVARTMMDDIAKRERTPDLVIATNAILGPDGNKIPLEQMPSRIKERQAIEKRIFRHQSNRERNRRLTRGDK